MTDLFKIFNECGPLTGKEIFVKTGEDLFVLWKNYSKSSELILKTVGERYLRLDKNIDGYARLSPSIIREFCNYTVIGTIPQHSEVLKKAGDLHKKIVETSRYKFELAKDTMERIMDSSPYSNIISENACFVIAGDVAWEMAHTEPRPEYSSGELVNGSDLDIEVIYSNLSGDIVESLDLSIYQQKAYLLKNPGCREEIDYIIKDVRKFEEQLEFDCFESMVAAKVVSESKFLCGNRDFFDKIKKMIISRGIDEKLDKLKAKAEIERETSRRRLLSEENAVFDKETMKLFYTTEEREEFF